MLSVEGIKEVLAETIPKLSANSNPTVDFNTYSEFMPVKCLDDLKILEEKLSSIEEFSKLVTIF